jgi:hypothetical protein
MYVYEQNTSELAKWIRDEVEFQGEIGRGKRGKSVRRVQEWLNLHGFGLVVDEDFGGVTERLLARFQEHRGLGETGVLDETTFAALVEPMKSVLRQRLDSSTSVENAILEYARAHLSVSPREIGGQNRGPWVRLYMKGKDGKQYPWCAGFVTFLLRQACQSLDVDVPIKGSGSCDSLAAQGKDSGLFLSESQLNPEALTAGSIFLVRRTSTDWTHTGLVSHADENMFDTIEGNTNDEGLREGFEVCARSRGYDHKDFILLS